VGGAQRFLPARREGELNLQEHRIAVTAATAESIDDLLHRRTPG
jgi:hypothetical protein